MAHKRRLPNSENADALQISREQEALELAEAQQEDSETREGELQIFERELEAKKQQMDAAIQNLEQVGTLAESTVRQDISELPKVDQLPAPDAPATELKHILEARLQQATSAKELGVKFLEQAQRIIKEVEILNFSQPGEIQKLPRLVADFSIAIKHAQDQFTPAQDLPRQLSLIDKAYKHKLAQENGFDSPEDAENKVYKPSQQATELRYEKVLGFLPLGAWKNRKEIRELQAEYERRRKLRDALNEGVMGTAGPAFVSFNFRDLQKAVRTLTLVVDDRIKGYFVSELTKRETNWRKADSPLSREQIREAVRDSRPQHGRERIVAEAGSQEPEHYLTDKIKWLEAALSHIGTAKQHLERLAIGKASESILAKMSPIYQSIIGYQHDWLDRKTHRLAYHVDEAESLEYIARNLDLNAWEKLKRSPIGQSLNPEDIQNLEQIFARISAAKLREKGRIESYDEPLLRKAFAFGDKKDAPVIWAHCQDYIRNSASPIAGLLEYADRIKAQNSPEVESKFPASQKIIDLIAERRDVFSLKVPNPEYLKFQEELRKDPELIGVFTSQLIRQGLEYITVNTNAGTVRIKYKGQNTDYLIATINDGSLQSLDVPVDGIVDPSHPQFHTILEKALGQQAEKRHFKMADEDEERSARINQFQIMLQENYRGEREAILVPELMKSLLKKYAHSENLLETIDNPNRQKLLQLFGELTAELFVNGDEKDKKLALWKLMQSPEKIDLREVAQYFEHYRPRTFREELLDTFLACAATRAQMGDGQLAWVVLKRTANGEAGFDHPKTQYAVECYAAFVNADLTPEQLSVISKAYGVEPSELRAVNNLVADLKNLGGGSYRYQADKFDYYVNLSKIPNLINTLRKLELLQYQLDPTDADHLAEIEPVADEVTRDLLKFKNIMVGTALSGRLKDWKKLWEISKNEKIIACLQELNGTGYQYGLFFTDPDEMEKYLFELVAKRGDIMRSMTEIKRFFPGFECRPSFGHQHGQYELEPYDLALQQMSYGNFNEALVQHKSNPGTFSENWHKLLMAYIAQEEDLRIANNFPQEAKEYLKQIFSPENPEARKLCLEKLREGYRDFLISGASRRFPPEIRLLLSTIDAAEGAGPLKYIELLGQHMGELRKQIDSGIYSEELVDSITQKLLQLEQRFDKERWGEDDRAIFYGISKDILRDSPIIYNEILIALASLKPKDMMAFVRDSLPLSQATLILAQTDAEGTTFNIQDLLKLQRDLETLALSLSQGDRQSDYLQAYSGQQVKELQGGFKDRFGIKKAPETWNDEKVRFVQNFIRYLGNISHRDAEKEHLLALFMALNINDRWGDFRQGKELKPEEYFDGDRLQFLKAYLEQRKTVDIMTAQSLGMKQEDLPEFQKLMQEETVEQLIGNVETIDIKLGSLSRNLKDLGDEDAYPAEKDKALLRLCKTYGKNVGSALQKSFGKISGKKIEDFSEAELQVVSGLEKLTGSSLTKESIQSLQVETRPMGLVANVLHYMGEQKIPDEINELQKRLPPRADVIEIFNKIGENFQPESGAMALSQDLAYLENIIVKNQDKLNATDRETLTNYLSSIREQMQKLEGIYQKLMDYTDRISKSVHAEKNPQLADRVREIQKIATTQTSETAIVSRMTNNFNLIIENMRQCLGCLRKEVNNDTNLTFGDNNKFYFMSQTAAERGSIADEVVVACPTKYSPDNTEISFVFDQVYGNKSADILLSHVKTALKKYEQLKRRFPEAKLSLLVTHSALGSAGLNEELFFSKLKSLGIGADRIEIVEAAGVTVPRSAGGDHYVEFGDGARAAGERMVKGLAIR